MSPRQRVTAFACAFVTLLSGTVEPARAQEHPAVFLHGLKSSPDAWLAESERLAHRSQIVPHRPALDWRASYSAQAAGLSSLSSLPSSRTLAIGHSNGGVVAREWSRNRSLVGVLTVGTPHNGAPLVSRFGEWSAFAASTKPYVDLVSYAFSRPSNTSFIMYSISSLLSWSLGYATSIVVDLAGTLAIDWRLPVMTEMRPGSAYLSALNSPTNLAREATAAPQRAGIVTIAHNYFWAGPMRPVIPEAADQIATALYGTIAGLDFWATWLLVHAPQGDPEVIQQVQALFSLSAHLASIDPTYCAVVSSVGSNQCVPHDGVVPHTSQRYPNALNVVLGMDGSWAPVHTRQTQQTDDVVYSVLTEVFRVPQRTSTPTPSPVPPPSESPEEPADDPADDSARPDLMLPGDMLRPGDSVRSYNGRFELVYQGDGNLVLYENGAAQWASGTHGRSAGFVIMQHDGNFVIYDANDVPIWTSQGTFGHDGAWLIVQDDGNVVIYSSDGVPLWATNTAR